MQMETKRARVAILIYQTKQTLTRDHEGHYVMIKGSIHREDITIITIYVPNIRALLKMGKVIKKK